MWGEIIGAATDALGGSLSGLAYVVPSEADKYNEKRLKKLKRQAELEALGLSEEERQAYFSILNQPATQARAALTDAQSQALMAYDTQGSGQALKLSQLAAEEAAKTESAIGSQILGADLQAQQDQAQELQDRLAYQAKREQQKAQVALSFFMPLLVSAGDIAQQQMTVNPPKPKTIKGETLDPEAEAFYADLEEFDSNSVAPDDEEEE
jgi:hypothetical protein